uniref:Uncharacterized protein n=1 Tax=Lotus japonicus TaxID=34305 RepID=I3SBF8_LOTJA|nr:unknown [Lotus japonicus]
MIFRSRKIIKVLLDKFLNICLHIYLKNFQNSLCPLNHPFYNFTSR